MVGGATLLAILILANTTKMLTWITPATLADIDKEIDIPKVGWAIVSSSFDASLKLNAPTVKKRPDTENASKTAAFSNSIRASRIRVGISKSSKKLVGDNLDVVLAEATNGRPSFCLKTGVLSVSSLLYCSAIAEGKNVPGIETEQFCSASH